MDDVTHIDPLLGTTVGGRYLLREESAEGDRWRRYIAELDGRRLLVTMISSRDLKSVDVEHFSDRCGRFSAIEHPRLATLVDFGREPDGDLFIVESGEVWHDLAREFALKGVLRPGHALRLMLQLLAGLDALHSAGIIHGGLSPSMLRLGVGEDGRSSLQVAPLGIALETAYPGDDVSVRPFRPPDGRKGGAADLFAVGRMLALLLTGEIDAEAAEATLAQRREALPSGISEALERALGPEDPFVSASEMGSVLAGGGDRPRFGRFTLLHRLARGGMGEIYLARAEGIEGIEGTSRLCVIKTIRTNLASDPDLIQRFVGEVRVLAALAHGNIVPVYDVGRVGDAFYIAMEYVPGKDLHRILRRARDRSARIPLPVALFIARELANGLAYAHRTRMPGGPGLVHRDVSPQNTLISYAGEVKLIDFGLALGGHGRPTTREGVVLGKLCYISPEQARAEVLDQRTDIYSLGLVFFEMLTGEAFFNQPTVDEVMQHVASPTPEAPSARRSDIPEDVDQICLRAMAALRGDRYESVGELRDDLSAALARLAPRTNPEEVGEFVAQLFPNAAAEDEQLLSDLSGTLPVLQAIQGGGETDADQNPAAEVTAVSVLNPERAPISMASALIPIDSLTEPSVVRDGEDPSPSLAPTLGGEAASHQGRGSLDADLAVEIAAWEQSHDDSGFPFGRLVVLFALVVVLLGAGVALILYRHAATRRMASERVHLALAPKPAMSVIVANTAARVRQQHLDSTRTRPAVAAAKAAKGALRAFCFLKFSGGKRGMRIYVDGKFRGKIPITKPLLLRAGKTHTVVVRYPRYRSRPMTLKCVALQVYDYELQADRFRRSDRP